MDLTIHNAVLDTTLEPVNIGINGDRIEAVQSAPLPPGLKSIDAKGAMISPAFIDPHFHLENALLSNDKNNSGTLREAIDIAARIKNKIDTEDIVKRSTVALREAIKNGTLWMRSHTDIDQIARHQLLDGNVAVKNKFKDVVDIQIVAFPQLGLTRNPEAVDLMWSAMERGADMVGGMPHGEKDMEDAAKHIEIAFEIAKKHNADIDMHVDETDDPYWHTLELLAEKTIEENYQGRVTAGHCCAMAGWSRELTDRVIGKVKAANVHIITNAPVNLVVQGHGDEIPSRRGIAKVKALLEAGVNVSCGQDDLLNMFYPFGKMDMLEVANFVAHAAHLTSPGEIQAAFDMPRYNAARILHLEDYGIKKGAAADLVLISADSAVDAIRRQPERPVVVRKGKLLVETERIVKMSVKIPY